MGGMTSAAWLLWSETVNIDRRSWHGVQGEWDETCDVLRRGLILSWVWWQWEILCLEWQSNPHFLRSGYVAPCQRSQCRILSSSPWNFTSFNAYNYNTGNDHTYIYIHRVGSTIIQCAACTGSWSQQPAWKWEIVCLEWESNLHLFHSRPVPNHYIT